MQHKTSKVDVSCFVHSLKSMNFFPEIPMPPFLLPLPHRYRKQVLNNNRPQPSLELQARVKEIMIL